MELLALTLRSHGEVCVVKVVTLVRPTEKKTTLSQNRVNPPGRSHVAI